jgi:hypothetical protein
MMLMGSTNTSTPLAISQIYGILDMIMFLNGRFISPTIVLLGLFNNILVVIVLSLPQYRNNACCLFLKILAMVDSVTLIALGVILTENIMSTMIGTIGDPFCALLGFIANFTPVLSSWTIIGITTTRFIAVVFPLKASAFTTMKVARTYMLILIFLFFLLAIPDLIYTRVPSDGATGDDRTFECATLVSDDVLAAYELGHSCLSYFLPLLVLIILNIPIACSLGRRRKDVAGMVASAGASKEDRTVMLMVMVVTVTFFLLVVPFVFHVLVWYVLSSFHELDAQQVKYSNFSYTITTILYALNCSINFLLYFIACKRFRKDFIAILKCECR